MSGDQMECFGGCCSRECEDELMITYTAKDFEWEVKRSEDSDILSYIVDSSGNKIIEDIPIYQAIKLRNAQILSMELLVNKLMEGTGDGGAWKLLRVDKSN